MPWYRYSIVQENFCWCAYRTTGVNITVLKIGFCNTQRCWEQTGKLNWGGVITILHTCWNWKLDLENGGQFHTSKYAHNLPGGNETKPLKLGRREKTDAICFQLGINIHWYIPIYIHWCIPRDIQKQNVTDLQMLSWWTGSIHSSEFCSVADA